MKRLAIILLLAGSLSAQTANVIELSPADHAAALKSWLALKAAEDNWNTEVSHIERLYVPKGTPGQCTDNAENRCVPDEWYPGIEFSKDFKYIVPKPNTGGTASTTTAWPVVNCPGGTGPCLLVK